MCVFLPGGKQSQGSKKGTHTFNTQPFKNSFPLNVAKPTSRTRLQKPKSDRRMTPMMHIPKNAELFSCEQLCKCSKLTQFSASPPLEPRAKAEPCQTKGWRKKGSRESQHVGSSSRGSACESTLMETTSILERVSG